MSRHERMKSASGYYHIMLRGNERKGIFIEEEDKRRFIETLYERRANGRFHLHAFCLMDNHVHLMLSEGMEEIAKVMKRITVSYVSYFNKKYNRVGHLFQDRFKSEVVEDDAYVLALLRYIHRNPVKAGLTKTAGEYKWSSYMCYLEEEQPFNKVLDKEVIIEMFSEDKEKAKTLYIKFTNQESSDEFIDLMEAQPLLADEDAKQLYEQMFINQDDIEQVIKAFRQRTNLSIRRIAAISGINKDRVNRIVRGT
jgi:putative transposase